MKYLLFAAFAMLLACGQDRVIHVHEQPVQTNEPGWVCLLDGSLDTTEAPIVVYINPLRCTAPQTCIGFSEDARIIVFQETYTTTKDLEQCP